MEHERERNCAVGMHILKVLGSYVIHDAVPVLHHRKGAVADNDDNEEEENEEILRNVHVAGMLGVTMPRRFFLV